MIRAISTLMQTGKKQPVVSFLKNRMMMYVLLLLPALLFTRQAVAQVSQYTFTASAGTYVPITGGTQLNATIPDSWTSSAITLSPGFAFGGTVYTTAFITSNGLITLGGSAPSTTSYNAIATSTGSGIAICPLNGDLNGATATGAAPEIRFETVGAEHVFQWTDVQRYNVGEVFNIQARLNTVTGVIRFIYGGALVPASSTSFQPVVGIRTSTTDYKNILVSTGAETWAAPLPGTSTSSGMRFTGAAPAKSPTAGQTYTFAPPSCIQPPSGLPAAPIAATTATVNWTASPINPASAYEIYYSTSATAPTSATTPNATSTGLSQSLSPLVPNTLYYAWVRANCGAADKSAWTALPTFTTLCSAVSPNYLENFTTYVPSCWIEQTGYLTAAPSALTGTSSAWTNDGWLNSGTTGAAKINIFSNSKREWLISPSINLGTAGNYQLEFDLATLAFGATTALGLGSDDTLAVVISTDNGATWSRAGILQVWTAANTPVSATGTHVVLPLSAYTGTVKIGFYAGEGAVDDVPDLDVMIDNFAILPLAACQVPGSVAIGSLTGNSASVTFTGTGNAYIVEYGPVGFTPGTAGTAGVGGTIVTGSGSPINISGLVPFTSYDVYVRNNCTSTAAGYSVNSSKNTFTTLCQSAPVTGTTPGSRCGTGTVVLGATSASGILTWYDVATGGTSLGTGASFTTPVISATTNFYVGTESPYTGTATIGAGGTTGTGVAYNPTQGGYGGLKGQYLFTASELRQAGIAAGNITQLALEFTTAGSGLDTFTIQIGTTTLTTFPTPVSILGGLTTAYSITRFTPVVGVNNFAFSTPFNWDGVSNIVISTSWSNRNSSNTASTIKYDATTNYASQTYRKDNETSANMLAFTGATGSGTNTFDRSLNRPMVIFNGQIGCSSLRTAVAATISTAPAFSITGNQTVCNNAIRQLTVTSTLANYNSYVWTPATNLYTDAAATVPYVTGANASTVYFRSATAATTTYTANANNTTTFCAQVATVDVTVLPTTATATATPAAICISGTVAFALDPASGYGTGSIQWQSSTNNSTFTDVTGATGSTYTTPVLTNTAYYRAVIKNSAGAVCFNSVSDTALINNPAIAGTTPGARCGPGTVDLSAAAAAGVTLNWYSAASGGSPVGTGTTFTTPSISATTNYYVEPSMGGGAANVGPAVNATTLSYFITNSWGITFNSTAPTTIQSVAVYPSGAGTMTISVQSAMGTGATIFGTYTATFTAAQAGTKVVLPINIAIPTAGTGYKMVVQSSSGFTGVHRETSPAPGFPYTTAGSPVTLTSSEWGGTTTATYYFFYDWVVSSACNGPRTLVPATINPKPDTAVTVTGNTSICPGRSVTFTAASGTGLTYQWLLNNAIIPGATASTYMATAAGSYRVKVATASCADTSNARVVTVLPGTVATVTPGGPTTFCAGGRVVLNGPAAPTGTTYQWQLNNADIAGATALSYTATATGNYRLYVANGACADTSAVVAVTVNNGPVTTVTAGGPVTFCNGGQVLLTGATGTGYTYQWQRNTTAIAGATTNTYSATTAGNYRLVVSNGTCTDTSAVTVVTILAKPVSTITAGGATTICMGNATLLNGPAPVAGVTYQWQRNAVDIAGATATTYAAVTSGSYRLVLSNGACADTSAAIAIVVNPKPVATATAGGPVAFCTGGSVVLNANTGTGITYRWMRNAALITPAATASSYTATTSGSYMVIVTNTATGCADTATAIVVTVSTPAANTLNISSGTVTFCQGGSVTFQAAVGTGYTYSWYKDGGLIPGATTFSYTTSTAGIYHAVVVSGTCTTTTITRTVVVNPLPVAAITAAGATNFCQGDNVVLSANTGTGLTYSWRRNGIANGVTSATFTATTSGTYDVIVSNASCSATSNSVIVIVSTPPTPVINASGPTTICQGNSVTLSTAANPAYTYQWKRNGIDIAGANSANYLAEIGGNYTVVVTNGACVVTSAALPVTVNALPPARVLPQGPTTFCQGGAVTLHASIAPGFSYQWYLNSAPINGATGSVYVATASGDYSVVIADANCSDLSPDVRITVNPVPALPIITVTNGTTLTTGNYITYQWYLNGAAIQGATSRSHTAVANGNYTVLVTNFAGCEMSSEAQPISSVGVDNVVKAMVRIYPNPASTTIHIDADKVVNISIRSVDGKEVIRKENAKDIDLQHLADGVYLIRITDKQGQFIKNERLVKAEK